MNKKIKQQWVAALRSGKFTQGYGQLVHHSTSELPTAHCVLGVLCHLAVEASQAIGRQAPHPDDDHTLVDGHETIMDGYADLNGDWAFDILPHGVRKWAQLEKNSPRIRVLPTSEKTRLLTSINDNGGSFSVMAKLIDEQL